MNEINYYKATVVDVTDLVENRIAFALELSGEQPIDKINELRKQMMHYFSDATVNGECISILAKCNKEVAGIGTLHIRQLPGNFKNPTGKWGYVMNMYTVPKYRRRGICKDILNALVKEGEKVGVAAFELHATKEGEFVYVQNGFLIHEEPTYRKFLTR